MRYSSPCKPGCFRTCCFHLLFLCADKGHIFNREAILRPLSAVDGSINLTFENAAFDIDLEQAHRIIIVAVIAAQHRNDLISAAADIGTNSRISRVSAEDHFNINIYADGKSLEDIIDELMPKLKFALSNL